MFQIPEKYPYIMCVRTSAMISFQYLAFLSVAHSRAKRCIAAMDVAYSFREQQNYVNPSIALDNIASFAQSVRPTKKPDDQQL